MFKQNIGPVPHLRELLFLPFQKNSRGKLLYVSGTGPHDAGKTSAGNNEY